ncbi:MAG TPA: hypothetical protein VIN10_12435 [Bacteroidales bacterium]
MKIAKFNILFILFFCSFAITAQNSINSPYSRFGLGVLHGRNVNTVSMGMGGVAYAINDPTMVNPANPASYAAFDSTSFIFEASLIGNFDNIKTNVASEKSSYMTLNYVLLGFPVSKWWKTSLGVMPYSKIGFNVKITAEVDNFSNVVNELNGEGGLNQFYWGNGFKIGKNLKIGFDATYVFGQGSRSSLVYYPDSLYIRSTKVENSTTGKDFIFDYGLQYDFHLNNDRLLRIGLVYANTFYMKATQSSVGYTMFGGYSDFSEDIQDTIFYIPEDEGLILIPQQAGVGITLLKSNRWLVSADFAWQQWNSFEAFGQNDSLTDAWRIAVGGQYTPKFTSISNYFTKVTYRAGFRYENTYLYLFGKQISGYGISFGLSLPLKNSKSGIDIGFEFGKLGTTENNLLQTNFVNFSLGISIFESWFNKRKYN